MGSALSFLNNDSLDAVDNDSLEANVVETRLVLLTFLPRELVDIVLDEAEYWPQITIGNQTQEHTVRADPADEFDSSSCCLLTQPLFGPGEHDELKRPQQIQKLIFSTDSRDQGWGGPSKEELDEFGPNHGSWTWFEASIVREGTGAEHFPKGLRAQDIEHEVAPPLKRWYVHCNRTAHREHIEHVTTWTVHDEDFEDDDSARGCKGKIGEFFGLLQPGDRIALIARAKYPQWVNYVRAARIDIVYSV